MSWTVNVGISVVAVLCGLGMAFTASNEFIAAAITISLVTLANIAFRYIDQKVISRERLRAGSAALIIGVMFGLAAT